MKEIFTKYEIARILGARALQIAMDAPLLLKIDKEKLEEVKYDALKIAELEFNEGVLPITVKRPLPKKLEAELKRKKEEVEKEEKKEEKVVEKKKEEKKEDKKIEEKEKEEEKEIKEEGEIMELATPEDEIEAEEKEEEGIE